MWDADAVRDDLRSYVVDQLGRPGGILVADETGFAKKGRASAGVQRQYSGTLGKVDNCQIGVFLAYVADGARALIDRRLYLPEDSWCADPARRARAGVPEQMTFATKPQLALQMIVEALDGGVDASWVTADEVYGNDRAFRAELERRGVGYVLAVACDHTVYAYSRKRRVDAVAAMLPRRPWQTRSAGIGAKGPRDFDWAWISIDNHPQRWLLIRRNLTTGELAFYRCWAPQRVPLATLVAVAGSRWSVEELFQISKSQLGLDHYQVRTWTGWHRFVTLAMLALAFLAVVTATHRSAPHIHPTAHAHHDDPIDLTMAEIRRLLAALTTSVRDLAHLLTWSTWRRTVQARARKSHYRRRLAYDAHG